MYWVAIAEHSMCHPGRPGPQADSQPVHRACRLPQREIPGVTFAVVVRGVGGGLQIVEFLPRQFPRRPDGPPGPRSTRRHRPHMHGRCPQDVRSTPGSAGCGRSPVVRPWEVGSRALRTPRRTPARSAGPQPTTPRTLFGGLRDDLVVDVGDVADHRHVVAAGAQPAPQHVEHHPGRRCPTRRGLHGGTAVVDRHLALFQGCEVTHSAGGGVIQAQGHCSSGIEWPHESRAIAASPSPRPVRPRPSVVVADR